MAYNQNRQGRYGQYSSYEEEPGSPRARFGDMPPRLYQQDAAGRGPSFDEGDDRMWDDHEEWPSPGHRNSSSAGMQELELFIGAHGFPGRTSSMASSTAAAGHQQQHQPYNPLQYARTDSQYGGVQGPAASPLLAGPNAGLAALGHHHQPYVPAAYSATTPPQPPEAYPTSPMHLSFPNPSGPPLPPRPYDQPAGSGAAYGGLPQQGSRLEYAQRRQGMLPHCPSNASSYPPEYTPPAPPPPPFMPPSPSPASYFGAPAAQYPAAHPSPGHSVRHHQSPSLPSYQVDPGYSPSAFSPRPSLPQLPPAQPLRSPPEPPQHLPQRTATTDRHPQARPLPGPPAPSYDGSSAYIPPPNGEREHDFDYDDIMKEVEDAMMGGARGDGATPAGEDDSDAEAVAGLAAMQMADEREAADLARESGSGAVSYGAQAPGSNHLAPPPTPGADASSDSDVQIDMDAFGGGFHPGQMGYGYGQDPAVSSYPAQGDPEPDERRYTATSLLSGLDFLSMPEGDYYLSSDNDIHPFPSFGARTDTGGTGGLSEPGSQPRRLSFEDGDEAALIDRAEYEASGTFGPAREYSAFPPRGTSRPLPSIPGSVSAPDVNGLRRQAEGQYGQPLYPQAPDEYPQGHAAGPSIYKANSIGSLSHTPLVIPPGRSITDAERRRKHHSLTGGRHDPAPTGPDDGPASGAGLGSPTFCDLDLPAIPAGKRRRFVPAKLSTNDFRRCPEPWAASSVLAWAREMAEGEADLKEQLIVDGIVALFTHKVPTMNTADAEVLSARLVQQMIESGALLRDEEWVRFGAAEMSGVIFQLTGTGCYSPRLHAVTVAGRCYAHHCMRTLRKINLQAQAVESQRKAEDWATFYRIKKEDLENVAKKDVERQNNLHEIVTSEDYYMDQLNVLKVLYRDGLASAVAQPAVLPPQSLAGFLKDVFGKLDAVAAANEDYLLAQLKYRQEEQGPWIRGFSDIFREWIRKARVAYVEYAASFPLASLTIRTEAERNVLFRQFLDQMREDERSRRLGWDTYLKAPITRLQRYGLLLSTVHKNTTAEGEEKANLAVAIEEIKAVTLECDSRVAEMSKRTDLLDLSNRLRLRPGMENVRLNLNHMGREIVFRGDLQRKGTNKVSWLETHAILFDHYLVLSKPVQQRDAVGGLRQELYDVSKLPVPMDLLVLESMTDDAVVKSAVKGIASVSTVNRTTTATPQDGRLGRTASNQPGTPGPGTLQHRAATETSSLSSGSNRPLVPAAGLDTNDRVMYPFRIRHLGKADVYVLYAPTAQNRADWCDKIIEAKTRHASSLFRQNAEPFRLRVIADTAFAYPSDVFFSRGVVIKGTPLDRAVEEVERAFYGTGPKPGPICRATVNCATSFTLSAAGKTMVAVGTDFGVYVSEHGDPRGWSKAINATHVTQIAVLEDFSIFLIISEKSLVAYHLDTVCPADGRPAAAAGETLPSTSTSSSSSSSSSRRAPQKLSGSKDVGFFATGRMKERTLVFYKKRDGISSTFKVLEPVYQKSSAASRGRFALRKGTTDFFRDFDDFYIPSETYGLNLFHSSLAISTARGIEVLTLDKKVPFSIPDLKPPEVASIAQRIAYQKPLGMFKLTENEFLLVFEEVGIYVDKHGDVSRAVVMEFVGRARQAVLFDATYLILVDVGGGFVEIRNAVNGRLRQVVSGRDVRLLDDGSGGGGAGTTVKICMQHPEFERGQIVVELIVNEGLKE